MPHEHNIDIKLEVRYHGLKATQYFSKWTTESDRVFREDLTTLKLPHPKRENTTFVSYGYIQGVWPSVPPHGVLHKNIERRTGPSPDLQASWTELSITNITAKYSTANTLKRSQQFDSPLEHHPSKKTKLTGALIGDIGPDSTRSQTWPHVPKQGPMFTQLDESRGSLGNPVDPSVFSNHARSQNTNHSASIAQTRHQPRPAAPQVWTHPPPLPTSLASTPASATMAASAQRATLSNPVKAKSNNTPLTSSHTMTSSVLQRSIQANPPPPRAPLVSPGASLVPVPRPATLPTPPSSTPASSKIMRTTRFSAPSAGEVTRRASYTSTTSSGTSSVLYQGSAQTNRLRTSLENSVSAPAPATVSAKRIAGPANGTLFALSTPVPVTTSQSTNNSTPRPSMAVVKRPGATAAPKPSSALPPQSNTPASPSGPTQTATATVGSAASRAAAPSVPLPAPLKHPRKEASISGPPARTSMLDGDFDFVEIWSADAMQGLSTAPSLGHSRSSSSAGTNTSVGGPAAAPAATVNMTAAVRRAVQLLTRDAYAVRREIAAGKVREAEILAKLKELDPRGTALATLATPPPEEDAEVRKYKAKMEEGFAALKQAKGRITQIEKELEAEQRMRQDAELAIQDIRRECRVPFVVPSLLDAFVELSRLTTEATTKADGNSSGPRVKEEPS